MILHDSVQCRCYRIEGIMSVCSDGASQGRIGIFAHVITVSGFHGNPNPFLPFIITPPLPTFSFAVMTARLAELLVPW